jgi:hypothetical protein
MSFLEMFMDFVRLFKSMQHKSARTDLGSYDSSNDRKNDYLNQIMGDITQNSP